MAQFRLRTRESEIPIKKEFEKKFARYARGYRPFRISAPPHKNKVLDPSLLLNDFDRRLTKIRIFSFLQ